MKNESTQEQFKHWAIVELMGHVRLAGMVMEEERFGCVMGRIDIPTGGDTFITQYFGGQSVYCITPTTEEIARLIADDFRPPVNIWEVKNPTLQPPPPTRAPVEPKYPATDYDDQDPFIDD